VVVASLRLTMPQCPADAVLRAAMAAAHEVAERDVRSVSCRPAASRRLSPRPLPRQLQQAAQLVLDAEIVARNASAAAAIVQLAEQLPNASSQASTAFVGAFTIAGVAPPSSIAVLEPPRVLHNQTIVVTTDGIPVGRDYAVPTPAPAPVPEEDSLDKFAIVGITLGVVGFVTLSALGLYFLYRRKSASQGGFEMV